VCHTMGVAGAVQPITSEKMQLEVRKIPTTAAAIITLKVG
jgi:hypothetical protein